MRLERLSDRAADTAAYEGYLASLAEDNSAFRAAFRQAFFRAMREQLTGRQYEILWLSEVEGLSGKEIACRLGISQSAVSRHRTRAKKRLRILLSYNLDLQHESFDRHAS